MRRSTRDRELLQELSRTGQATIAELAGRLDVGETTVRRSLQRLAKERRVVRTYGGAALPGPLASQSGQLDAQAPYKRMIGATASSLVSDGDTIALSSGSTVLELAHRLRSRRLTVITNAMDVVNVLLDAPDIELVVLGGVMLPGLHSLRGHLTELAMRELRADKVFMGASAIDPDRGFMTHHVPEIAVDRSLSMMGREVVVVADASKFNRVAPGFMLTLDQVGGLVTDHRITAEMRDRLEANGMRVIVCDVMTYPGDGTDQTE